MSPYSQESVGRVSTGHRGCKGRDPSPKTVGSVSRNRPGVTGLTPWIAVDCPLEDEEVWGRTRTPGHFGLLGGLSCRTLLLPSRPLFLYVSLLASVFLRLTFCLSVSVSFGFCPYFLSLSRVLSFSLRLFPSLSLHVSL